MSCLLVHLMASCIKPLKMCAKLAGLVLAICTLLWLIALTVIRYKTSGVACSYNSPGYVDAACLYMLPTADFMAWSVFLLWPFLFLGVLGKMFIHKNKYDEPQ